MLNEEKFSRRLQFDDFSAVTRNLRDNVQEVLDSLRHRTTLSRSDKDLVRSALNGFLIGTDSARVQIRVVYGKKGPGVRLLERFRSETGLRVDAIHVQDL